MRAAPRTVVRARAADRDAVSALADLVGAAKSPALVVGAGADDPDTWKAVVALAERLRARSGRSPSARAPASRRTIRLFAGHLPADRTRLRATLAPYDVVLVVGGPVFRQYPFVPGPFVEPGTRVAVVSEDPAEVHRSTAELAVLAHPGPVCAELARLVPARDGALPERATPPAPPAPPAAGESAPRRTRASPRWPTASPATRS